MQKHNHWMNMNHQQHDVIIIIIIRIETNRTVIYQRIYSTGCRKIVILSKMIEHGSDDRNNTLNNFPIGTLKRTMYSY